MGHYPYLIASLPELNFDAPFHEHQLTSHELFLFCQAEMSGEDLLQIRTFFLFNDIKNCVFFIFNTKQRKEDFAKPSYYDETMFMALKDNPGSMLPFMTRFYELKAQKQRLYPQLPETDELTSLFYQDLDSLVKPGFLKDWLVFYGNLRTIASALVFRKSGLAISSKLVQWGLAFDLIQTHESIPDFGLKGEFPFVTELIDTLETGSRLDFEVAIERLIWQWLSEHPSQDFDSTDEILAHFIRLSSLERWQELTPAKGQAVLDDIIQNVQRSIRFSIEFNKTGDR